MACRAAPRTVRSKEPRAPPPPPRPTRPTARRPGNGPGADAAHTDHLHVDMALHGTSDRYLPMTRYGSPAKLFASVKYRERRGNCEDKQGASCFWRCGRCVGIRGRRVRSRPTRATSIVIGGGSLSRRVVRSKLGGDG